MLANVLMCFKDHPSSYILGSLYHNVWSFVTKSSCSSTRTNPVLIRVSIGLSVKLKTEGLVTQDNHRRIKKYLHLKRTKHWCTNNDTKSWKKNSTYWDRWKVWNQRCLLHNNCEVISVAISTCGYYMVLQGLLQEKSECQVQRHETSSPTLFKATLSKPVERESVGLSEVGLPLRCWSPCMGTSCQWSTKFMVCKRLLQT